MQHLNFEDIERYIGEEEMSEEYLCWLEPVLSHLENCDICSKMIDKLMFYEDLCEKMDRVVALVGKEDQIRREYVTDYMLLMKEEELSYRLKNGAFKRYQVEVRNGALWKILSLDSNDMKKQIWKNTGVPYGKPDIVAFENGKLIVRVECEQGQTVSVIFVRMDKMEKPVCRKIAASTECQKVVAELSLPKQGKMEVERKVAELKGMRAAASDLRKPITNKEANVSKGTVIDLIKMRNIHLLQGQQNETDAKDNQEESVPAPFSNTDVSELYEIYIDIE